MHEDIEASADCSEMAEMESVATLGVGDVYGIAASENVGAEDETVQNGLQEDIDDEQSIDGQDEQQSDENSDDTQSDEEIKNVSETYVSIDGVSDTVWATTNLNIRSSYSSASDIVGSLAQGSSIQRTGICSNGWYRVDLDGTDAYIYGKYLSTSAVVTSENSTQQTQQSQQQQVKTSLTSAVTINCDGFDISDDLKNQFNELLSNYSGDVKFYGISFDGSLSFGCKANTSFFAASMIKAGYALNLYKQVEAGNLDLNTILTYESGMLNTGAGVIKDAPYGTTYTVQELIDYSLLYSDNIAFGMLRDMSGRRYVSTYDSLMGSMGCTNSKLGSRNWTNTTAVEMVTIMCAIYNYSLTSEYGKQLLNTLYNTDWNAFQMYLPYKCASKYGYMDYVTCIAGIVFAETPYICCVSTPYESLTVDVIKLCNQIVEEYTASGK